MTPGNLGEKAARQRYILGDEQVVQISNYVGYMVRQEYQGLIRYCNGPS